MTAPIDVAPRGVSRFYLRSLFWAFAVHVFLGVILSLNAENSGGTAGGGKVLGRLSVSLGGSGPAGAADTEPLTSSSSVMPDILDPKPEPVAKPVERIVEALPARIIEVPEPRGERPRPARRDPVPAQSMATEATPRTPEATTRPVAPVASPAPTPIKGEEGDGKPIGETGVSTPTLGEGAASGAPGLGMNESAAANQRGAYLAAVRARVERERFYPSAARRTHAEGEVLLRMEIAADGRLIRIELLGGSGSFHLDRAAKRMVEKAAPFPPPPTASFTLSLPVAFALE